MVGSPVGNGGVERIAVRFHGGGNRDGLGKRRGGEGVPGDVIRFVLDLVILRLAPGEDLVALGFDDQHGAVHRLEAAEHVVDFFGEEYVFLRLDVHAVDDFGFGGVLGSDGRDDGSLRVGDVFGPVCAPEGVLQACGGVGLDGVDGHFACRCRGGLFGGRLIGG